MRSYFLLLFSLLLSSCGYNFWMPETNSCAKVAAVVSAANYCEVASAITDPGMFGSGTKADPYVLCSPYQLNAIGTNSNLLSANYKLDADLDMSCISGNHTQIGSSALSFSGNFDGNSNKIKNWKYVDPTKDYVGLFYSLGKGNIKNLSLENVTISGKTNVGALAGTGDLANIVRVSSSGTISGELNVGGLIGTASWSVTQSSSSANVSGNSQVGGLIGAGLHQQISSSYFTGSVNASAGIVGGIIGSTGGLIINSYSTGTVTSSGTKTGGIAGVSAHYIENCYSTGTVSGTTIVGGVVGSMSSSASNLINSFSVSSVTGSGGTAANVGALYGTSLGTTTNSYYWSGASCDADVLTGGIQACGVNATGSYALMTDLQTNANPPLSVWDYQSETANGTNDFWAVPSSDFPKQWYDSPVAVTAPFSGLGTEASPYLINNETDFNLIGFNPRWMSSYFRLQNNLDFNALTFYQLGGEESPFYGVFDGNNKQLLNITNPRGRSFAGVFGLALNSEIKDLTVSNVSITGTVFTGGLVGLNSGTIDRCSSSGAVNGTYHTGGLIGLNVGVISDSSSSANLSATLSHAIGGLVGNNTSYIYRSSSSGTITNAGSHSGGLVGMSTGTIEDSYSTSSVTASNSNSGGLVGNLSGTTAVVKNSYATGNVNGKNYAGSLIGNSVAGAQVINSFATGNVIGTGGSARVGSLVGNNLLTITNSYYLATATCDSDSVTGGIQACNTVSTGSVPMLSDFYDVSKDPLNVWDFTNVWTSDGISLPVLP